MHNHFHLVVEMPNANLVAGSRLCVSPSQSNQQPDLNLCQKYGATPFCCKNLMPQTRSEMFENFPLNRFCESCYKQSLALPGDQAGVG